MADKNGSSQSLNRANVSLRGRALERIPETLESLNSPDSVQRKMALADAVESFAQGRIVRPQETGWVNVLARTFFSFSIDSLSPTRLAWEAVIRGLSIIGCADRDNLGALGEMQSAGDALGIRATVSLETKTHVPSHADQDLNCAGEPGVLRALGAGFTNVPPLDSPHGRLIASLPKLAADRNRTLLDRLNAVLTPVRVDYAADVVPLTPAGNATEEHICCAYANKARALFPDLHDLSVFWADVLGRSPADIECLLAAEGVFLEILWEKLMRIGGMRNIVPAGGYPSVADFFAAVKAAGAVPCVAWRGALTTREDPGKMLDAALGWGARALSVFPDRFWNITDPEDRAARMTALAELVKAARARHMPILAGSVMSGPRQKFVDSFDAPELSAYFRDFMDSAFWLYGHATLQRALGQGAASGWADRAFGHDVAAANAFYLEIGKKAAPGKATRLRVAACGEEAGPEEIIAALAPLRL